MACALVALARVKTWSLHTKGFTLKVHIYAPGHFKRCPCKRYKQTNTNIKSRKENELCR